MSISRFPLRDVFEMTLKAAKWVPTVVCGLLVVAWVVSINITFAITCPGSGGGAWAFGCSYGSTKLCFSGSLEPQYQFLTFKNATNDDLGWFGSLRPQLEPLVDREISCPISILLTLVLPLAFAPFTGFRFRLWSYFAWTALIAAELAYYLR